MKSTDTSGILKGCLQVLHIHALLVDPLGTYHMAQSGTNQNESRIAVREVLRHTWAIWKRFWLRILLPGVVRTVSAVNSVRPWNILKKLPLYLCNFSKAPYSLFNSREPSRFNTPHWVYTGNFSTSPCSILWTSVPLVEKKVFVKFLESKLPLRSSPSSFLSYKSYKDYGSGFSKSCHHCIFNLINTLYRIY